MLKVVDRDASATAADLRRHRLREAIALHAIEDNPLRPEEIGMFETFEREGWSPDQRRAYILSLPD